mgnify:FL=1
MDWTGHIDFLGFGAFVLAAAGMMLRYIIRRSEQMAKDYKELVTNHLQHNTAAMVELRSTIEELTTWLRSRSG